MDSSSDKSGGTNIVVTDPSASQITPDQLLHALVELRAQPGNSQPFWKALRKTVCETLFVSPASDTAKSATRSQHRAQEGRGSILERECSGGRQSGRKPSRNGARGNFEGDLSGSDSSQGRVCTLHLSS